MKSLKLKVLALLLGALTFDVEASTVHLLCKGLHFARDGNWNFLGRDESATTTITLNLEKKTIALTTSFLEKINFPLQVSPERYAVSFDINEVIGGKFVKKFYFTLNRFSGEMNQGYSFDEGGVVEFLGKCEAAKPKF